MQVIAGSTARLVAAIVISPLELLRTRMQSGNKLDANLKDTYLDLNAMVKKHGLTSLWRGIGSTLWRDIPFSGSIMFSFTYTYI